MFKNYLKTALRNIKRRKIYSLINISGLAMGLCVFILAVLYTDFHFGFDRFHKDYDRIYTVIRAVPSGNKGEQHTPWTHTPLLPLMNREFPEIKNATRFIPSDTNLIRYGDKRYYEKNLWYVDHNFLSFFSFEMISGDSEKALSVPGCAVITESTAKKYFGETNPIGKVLHLEYRNLNITITGVTKKTPQNSSIRFDFLVSAEGFNWMEEWDTECATFLRLKKDIDPERLDKKFPLVIKKHVPNLQNRHERMYLFPLKDIHLKSMHIPGPYGHTTPVQLYLVISIALVLLLVVCINFMNLSTAHYMSRAIEVGIRKVMGANKHQFIKQFLGEAVLISFLSLPIAMMLYEIIRPFFLAIMGIDMNLSLWRNPILVITLVVVTVLVGIIAGSYPAFFLSSFKPINVLKKNFLTGPKGSRARKILVITQFALTVILVVFTLLIYKQFGYLMDSDLGYNRENIVILPIKQEIQKNLEPFKNELLKHTNITSVSPSDSLPFNWGPESKVQPEGVSEEEAWTMGGYPVGYDYIETLGMKIFKGRSYSRRYNDTDNYIISESAALQLGWNDPIGKALIVDGQKGLVIGVIRDFHFKHVFFKQNPNILYLRPNWINYIIIKLSSPPDPGVRSYIEEQWRMFMPDLPYEFSMLAHLFEEDFRRTTKASEIFKFISIVSVFVSCLGLFGLASFTVERRTKEIGIRKAVGASILNIVRMLISEFVKLVALSNLIAFPLAYLCSYWFLQWAWVYKTKIGITIFIGAFLLSLISALISVISQTIKAAFANPVEALKYE